MMMLIASFVSLSPLTYQMWHESERTDWGWNDAWDSGSGVVTCYVVEYGYPSDPLNPDTNGNGIDDYRWVSQ